MIKIPLETISIEPKGTHLVLDVEVNGNKLKVVLDTGASRSVFDLDYLKSIEPELVVKEEEAKSAGVGAVDIVSYTAVIESFGIGQQQIKQFEIAAMNLVAVLQSYEKIGAVKIHGVLGGDILLKGNAQIDYATKELRLDEKSLMGE